MRARTLLAALALVGLSGCHPAAPKAGPTSTSSSAAAGLSTVAPDPSPSASPGTGPATLGGTLFYLAIDSSGGTVLHAVIGDGTRTLASFPDLVPLAVDVAPDGQRVAWIQNAGTPSLVVANVDGSGRRVVGPTDADPCVDPQWSADSRRVLVTRSGKFGTIDVDSGTFAPLPKLTGCHPVWGRVSLAYGDGSGKVFVANSDGSGARAIPGIGTGTANRARSFDFESLSPDGTKLILDLHTGDMEDGDVARGLHANAVIDTRTGATVSTPGFDQGVFIPGGNLLTRRAGTLTLYAPDGHRLAQVTEPAKARNWVLLSYTAAG